MIRIITDSACLYTPTQAKQLGFDVNPLIVSIDNKSYEEFNDINSYEFIELIDKGFVPSSSQPSIGNLLDLLNKYKDDDIIVLSMADGLSGTYQSCLLAKQQIENNEKIHIINTKTLCGAQKYLVELTLKLINEKKNIDEIIKTINKKIETSISFLLPQDFDFLKRGGRLTPFAATISGLLKIQPVLKQTNDGKKLDKFVIGRNFSISVNKIIDFYKDKINENYNLYISHAFNLEQAELIVKKFKETFPNITIEILELSCAFITQGGPKCIAIQTIEI